MVRHPPFKNQVAVIRAGDIVELAAMPEVTWIGEQLPRQLLDEVQGQIIAGQLSGTLPSGPGYKAFLDNHGFSTTPADYPICDVTDDGFGNGGVNDDEVMLEEGTAGNPSRMNHVQYCTSEASGEGPDGHGHLNVSIAGGYDTLAGQPDTDANGYNRGLGMNPYGRFGATRIFDGSGFDISRCSGTDTGVIKKVQDAGAKVNSHSWGCATCAGTYDDSSQAYDRGVRDADLSEAGNQQMAMVFSAGNSGSSSGTIGTPGNGKNMITVGASENVRPTADGATWTDGCGIGASGANSAMDIISFSSRGPAPGGRVKPEVIAPGTHVQGTASTNDSYNGSGVCDQYLPTSQSKFAASSGTSHSCPALAGVASLHYWWLENVHLVPSPSPALIKAYMIAHPTYLTGISANDTLPSNNQGYGMPNLETAFDDTVRTILDQDTTPVASGGRLFNNTGEVFSLSVTVVDNANPVRVVLVYTDAYGAVGTSPQVNDLNLTVTLGASTYLGNEFSGQWSVTGGTADAANNYEAVFLPAGASGTMVVTVTAQGINGDGIPNLGDATDQDFALVVYNASECTNNPSGVDVIPNGPLALCTGTAQQLTATTTGGSGLSYRWYRDGSIISGATSSTYTANSTGSHTYNCLVTGGGVLERDPGPPPP